MFFKSLRLHVCANAPSSTVYRHHGARVREVRLSGHLPEEEQELCEHPVEAGSGKAAGLGHALPGMHHPVTSRLATSLTV